MIRLVLDDVGIQPIQKSGVARVILHSGIPPCGGQNLDPCVPALYQAVRAAAVLNEVYQITQK